MNVHRLRILCLLVVFVKATATVYTSADENGEGNKLYYIVQGYHPPWCTISVTDKCTFASVDGTPINLGCVHKEDCLHL
jgi:hypothetical protein